MLLPFLSSSWVSVSPASLLYLSLSPCVFPLESTAEMLWVLCPHTSGPRVTCGGSPRRERSPLFPRASPVKGGNSTHAQVSGVLSTWMDRICGKMHASGPDHLVPWGATCSEGSPFSGHFLASLSPHLPVLTPEPTAKMDTVHPVLVSAVLQVSAFSPLLCSLSQ